MYSLFHLYHVEQFLSPTHGNKSTGASSLHFCSMLMLEPIQQYMSFMHYRQWAVKVHLSEEYPTG